MADFDVLDDTRPTLENRNSVHYGRKTISQLKTALQALDPYTYTDAAIRQMTYNDMVAAIPLTAEREAPTISAHPQNESVADEGTASFSVTAAGKPTPTYQWQVQLLGAGDWEDLGGETDATLSFTAASADSTNKYRVIVTNNAGSVTSNAATLTVTA